MDLDRLEQVLDPGFLGDLTDQPIDELRAKRTECQELEVSSSYLRRVAQGRLDIVGFERRRRAGGTERLDGDHLVEQLSGVLADRGRPQGNGHLPQLLAPGADDIDTDELDAILGPAGEATLDTLSEADLDVLVGRLSDYEAEMSSVRRSLHERIDAIQAELIRRYKSGEVSVDSLLGDAK